MNNPHFGPTHYNIHLDMKLGHKKVFFQEVSISELETLHHLCELERKQILQSLALLKFKILYAGYLLSGKRSKFIDYEGKIIFLLHMY